MDRANIDLRAVLLVLFFEKLKETSDLLADFMWIYALLGGNPVDEGERLAYAQQRWYDPQTGSFISEDPVKDGLNYYSYCGNNPIGNIDPTGLTFIMGFPGTAYTKPQYGGTAFLNLHNPNSAGTNNNLYGALATTFSPNEKITSKTNIDWGGANVDYGQKPIGRMDNISKWLGEYRNLKRNDLKEGGEGSAIITALSHGNQVVKETLKELYKSGEDLSKVTYIAYSHPNRSDHRLDSNIATRLGTYLNIYNVYDKTAGLPHAWARTDIDPFYLQIDRDNNIYDKDYGDFYQKDAVNIALHGIRTGLVTSHTEVIESEYMVKNVLDIFSKNNLNRGDTLNLYRNSNELISNTYSITYGSNSSYSGWSRNSDGLWRDEYGQTYSPGYSR